MKSEPLHAYILAGGRSRRFGSDKARALLENQPLILRLARQLEKLNAAVSIVADRTDKFDDLGLTCIADHRPGLGPLGGLEAALTHRQRGWLLLCSCDLLEVRAEWIEQLWNQRSEDTSAVAFKAQRWEPFPGLYHTRLLPRVQRYLERGERSMQQLLAHGSARPVPLPADWPSTLQANTPAELRRYKRQDS